MKSLCDLIAGGNSRQAQGKKNMKPLKYKFIDGDTCFDGNDNIDLVSNISDDAETDDAQVSSRVDCHDDAKTRSNE